MKALGIEIGSAFRVWLRYRIASRGAGVPISGPGKPTELHLSPLRHKEMPTLEIVRPREQAIDPASVATKDLRRIRPSGTTAFRNDSIANLPHARWVLGRLVSESLGLNCVALADVKGRILSPPRARFYAGKTAPFWEKPWNLGDHSRNLRKPMVTRPRFWKLAYVLAKFRTRRTRPTESPRAAARNIELAALPLPDSTPFVLRARPGNAPFRRIRNGDRLDAKACARDFVRLGHSSCAAHPIGVGRSLTAEQPVK
jgi:hypothetical protein